MTVSRITASVDSESATRGLDRAAVREPYLLIHGALADQVSWIRVIRYARCADASLDADQWFPVSAEASSSKPADSRSVVPARTAAAGSGQPPGSIATPLRLAACRDGAPE
ncbi:MAG TPA: hypothetical protein VJO72_08980, partial [Candidatus Dormibacteraeota bacterium]|nr:hypothetical protein [Candidatus Dormibacteraeota bacterium]